MSNAILSCVRRCISCWSPAGMEIQGRCMAPLVLQLLGWDSASLPTQYLHGSELVGARCDLCFVPASLVRAQEVTRMPCLSSMWRSHLVMSSSLQLHLSVQTAGWAVLPRRLQWQIHWTLAAADGTHEWWRRRHFGRRRQGARRHAQHNVTLGRIFQYWTTSSH